MSATPPIARTPLQNSPVAWPPARPRPVPAQCPPARLRIGGSRTSIRRPFQALYEVADQPRLHLRDQLLGQQRFRAFHRQLCRQRFQLQPRRALRRTDFRFCRRGDFFPSPTASPFESVPLPPPLRALQTRAIPLLPFPDSLASSPHRGVARRQPPSRCPPS